MANEVPGCVIIKFKAETSEETIQAFLQSEGLVLNADCASVKGALRLVDVPVGQEDATILRLNQSPHVINAYRDFQMKPF